MNNNKINKKLLLLLISSLGLTACSDSDDSDPASSTDTDMDGVVDSNDLCAGTLEQYADLVDEDGCVAGQFIHYVATINAGGDTFTSEEGVEYQADTGFIGGDTSSTLASIQSTKDDELYKTERWGEFSYAFDVANNNYNITIHLAEIYHNDAGLRLMDISAEGQMLSSGLDIYSEVGKNTAHIISHTDIAVTDGQLNIDFRKNVDNAKVSAIEVSVTLDRAADEDGDGLANYLDACIYTSPTLINDVNEVGCSLKEVDADKDGIMDYLDQCLETEVTAFIDDNGCSAGQRDFDADGVMDSVDQCKSTASNTDVDDLGCDATEAANINNAFLEQDGLLVVDVASLNKPNGWTLQTAGQSINDRFLEYTGNDYFNDPGFSVLVAKIYIQNPGLYRFDWRNVINHGADPTEHNDSWLRINADNFYGHKSNGSIVCPREQMSSNQCVGNAPHGSSSKGWFKVYRSGGPTNEWKWAAYTSDNDSHAIYAQFDNVGEYEVRISGRSKHHAIDRFVLYRFGNDSDNVSAGHAQAIERQQSPRQD